MTFSPPHNIKEDCLLGSRCEVDRGDRISREDAFRPSRPRARASIFTSALARLRSDHKESSSPISSIGTHLAFEASPMFMPRCAPKPRAKSADSVAGYAAYAPPGVEASEQPPQKPPQERVRESIVDPHAQPRSQRQRFDLKAHLVSTDDQQALYALRSPSLAPRGLMLDNHLFHLDFEPER